VYVWVPWVCSIVSRCATWIPFHSLVIERARASFVAIVVIHNQSLLLWKYGKCLKLNAHLVLYVGWLLVTWHTWCDPYFVALLARQCSLITVVLFFKFSFVVLEYVIHLNWCTWQGPYNWLTQSLGICMDCLTGWKWSPSHVFVSGCSQLFVTFWMCGTVFCTFGVS